MRIYDTNVVKNYDEKIGRPYIGLLVKMENFYYFAPYWWENLRDSFDEMTTLTYKNKYKQEPHKGVIVKYE